MLPGLTKTNGLLAVTPLQNIQGTTPHDRPGQGLPTAVSSNESTTRVASLISWSGVRDAGKPQTQSTADAPHPYARTPRDATDMRYDGNGTGLLLGGGIYESPHHTKHRPGRPRHVSSLRLQASTVSHLPDIAGVGSYRHGPP